MKKKFCLWASIALFFSFSVLFYGPLGTYLSNAQELWFSLSDVLQITGTVAAAAFLAALLFGLILPKKINGFFAKLCFGGSLALYLQGNFLNISYGVLNGTAIDWSAYTTYAWIDTIVLLAVILLPFAIDLIPKVRKTHSIGKILTLASVFFIAMQLPAMLVQLFNYSPNPQQNMCITKEGLFDVAPQDNVLIFVLDTYDEAFFEDAIEDDPAIIDTLQDFVLYDDSMATGAYTIVAIPSFLTGQPFRRQNTYSEYIEESWSDQNAMSAMARSGYDVRVFTETIFFGSNTPNYISNFSYGTTQLGSRMTLAKKLYKLDGFIFLPHLLKQYLFFDTAEFDAAKKDGEVFTVNDVRLINDFRENGYSTNEEYKAALRIYHLNGTHEPFSIGIDANKNTKATRRESAVGYMTFIAEVLDDLKAKGLYDDATIIVMADHGKLNLATCPLFLLKEAHHTGEFTRNHAPLSFFDLPVYLGDLVGKEIPNQEYGMHLTDLYEGMERTRHFFYNNSGSGRVKIEEYVTTGAADDVVLISEYMDPKNGEAYTMGTLLDFTANATGNRYSTAGFGRNTGGRTRMYGPLNELQIPVADAPADGTITMTLTVYAESGVNANTIITVNDLELYNGVVDHSMHRHILSFEFPASIIQEANGLLTVQFRFPDITNANKYDFSLIDMVFETKES